MGLELSWSPWGASHSSEQATPTYRPQMPCHRGGFLHQPCRQTQGPHPSSPKSAEPLPSPVPRKGEPRAPPRAPHQQNCSCLRLNLPFEHSSGGASGVCRVWP